MRLVLVADASRAHLLQEHEKTRRLDYLTGWEHPAARARVRAPHAETRGTPKEVEAVRFAAALARALEHAISEARYDTVAIVAPPHFLGLVKARLHHSTRKRLSASIGKDLTKLRERELVLVLRHELHPNVLM